MQILPDLFTAQLATPSVITIGSFDGVHCGHRALIRATVERARGRGAASLVIVIHPHPKLVLGREPGLLLLTTLEERLELIAALGVDYAVVMPFSTEASQVTALAFVERLARNLRMAEIVCTPDFRFGHKRQGSVSFLQETGRGLGFDVTTVEPESYAGDKISSSRIRELVGEGNVSLAACLLGREHSVRGQVVSGDHRGRGLGFPTANLELPERKLFPANGIYAARVRLWNKGAPDEWFHSATSIGVRPTFGDGQRRLVEVHILDFDRDIYGQTLEAHFVQRLRDEQRFPSVAALIGQMRQDCEEARRILDHATECD